MKLIIDPEVHSDVLGAMEFYERVAGSLLAVEFHEEFHSVIQKVIRQPRAFSVRQENVRRANFPRFPFNLLYRLLDDSTIRILAVRHDSREPSFGIDRV